jgi:hypothetical protein
MSRLKVAYGSSAPLWRARWFMSSWYWAVSRATVCAGQSIKAMRRAVSGPQTCLNTALEPSPGEWRLLPCSRTATDTALPWQLLSMLIDKCSGPTSHKLPDPGQDSACMPSVTHQRTCGPCRRLGLIPAHTPGEVIHQPPPFILHLNHLTSHRRRGGATAADAHALMNSFKTSATPIQLG